MAYCKSKKNDIFISYAHDDDIESWVKNFARLLELKLNKQLKVLEHGKTADVKVFTDASLPPSGSLKDRLETEIMDSALLLVIMSESYGVSKWCKEEGEMFIRHLKGNRELTLFIAEKDMTDRDRWPDYLKDESDSPLRSQIFYEETDVGRYRPIPILDRTGAFNSEAGYFMEDFCRSICEALKNQNINLFQYSGGPLKRVCLALPPPSLDVEGSYFRELRAHLSELSGVELLEPNPLDLKETLSDILENCDLFVQILDNQKGYTIPDRKTGHVGYQYDEAMSKGVRILQWKVPGLDLTKVEDENYRLFLNSLKTVSNEGGTLVEVEKVGALLDSLKATLFDEISSGNEKKKKFVEFEIRSLPEDEKEADKVWQAIKNRSKVWNQGKGGEKIEFYPVSAYQIDKKNENVPSEYFDEIRKQTNATVIVYVSNFKWANNLEKEMISIDRMGRLAICDPWPKNFVPGGLDTIKMFKEASPDERDRKIDSFLEELAKGLRLQT